MEKSRISRRRLLVGGLALTAASSLSSGARGASGLVLTPRQTPGPFYPDHKPLDADNDLVRVAGQNSTAQGEVLHVFGQVKDTEGRILPGLLVELWQCDAFGRYHHPRDTGGTPDPNFQGYGQTQAAADGAYRFRTIIPVPYGGRTPHIHFAVTDPKGGRLTTQMYIRDHPMNERDFIFRAIADPAARDAVQATLKPAPEIEAGGRMGRFDIILGRNAS